MNHNQKTLFSNNPCNRRAKSPTALRGFSRPSGFTLLETLVALVIFGIITVALSLSFNTALRSQEINNQRQEEIGEARLLFDALTRDIQNAYVSTHYTSGVFMAGASSGGSGSTSSSLLTLMTRSHRIEDANSLAQSPNTSTFGIQQQQTNVPPQADVQLVRYDLDRQTGTLIRSISRVPNLTTLDQSAQDPDGAIAHHIGSLTLRFWDADKQNWRNDWDFEQANLQQSQSGGGAAGAGGSAGASGATGGASGSASSQNSSTNTGDTALPSAVEVNVQILRRDGQTVSYSTTIPIAANQAQDNMAPPIYTPPSSGTSGSTSAAKP